MSSVAEASTAEDSPFEVHYFPDPELNFWMFAMIGLGGAFIAFVGFSLYIMCRNK